MRIFLSSLQPLIAWIVGGQHLFEILFADSELLSLLYGKRIIELAGIDKVYEQLDSTYLSAFDSAFLSAFDSAFLSAFDPAFLSAFLFAFVVLSFAFKLQNPSAHSFPVLLLTGLLIYAAYL